MEGLYVSSILNEIIQLQPKHVNHKVDNNIIATLKEKVGDKCIASGYIKKDTISIVERSAGIFSGSQFSGLLSYDVRYKAQICFPVKGDIVKGQVKNINRLGLLVEKKPLSIIVIRDLHPDKDVFNGISIDDEIEIEIVASKFTLNSTTIDVIAKLKLPEKQKGGDIVASEFPIQDITQDLTDTGTNLLEEGVVDGGRTEGGYDHETLEVNIGGGMEAESDCKTVVIDISNHDIESETTHHKSSSESGSESGADL